MIGFAMPDAIRDRLTFVERVAKEQMRPAARAYDETEHQVPWDFVNTMWDESLRSGVSFRSGHGGGRQQRPAFPSRRFRRG